MTIEELKNKIETNTLSEKGLIFTYSKNRFVVDQYVKEISKLRNRPIMYFENFPITNDLFGNIDDGNLSVIVLEKLNENKIPDNFIVITKDKNDDSIIFPELEDWQIKDYVFSICKGVDERNLEKIIKANKDIYSLQNELDKLTIFNETNRKNFCEQFLSDGIFSNISKVEAFDFSNAVQNQNKELISEMYKNYEKEPLSFVGLMYKQFRNMVNVYLQNNPTPENTGLKDKQIWAIKNVCKKYTKQQVFDIFKFLSDIDYKLKSGKLSTDIMFDYVLIKLFSLV